MGKKEYLAAGFAAGILVGILLAALIFQTGKVVRQNRAQARAATAKARIDQVLDSTSTTK